MADFSTFLASLTCWHWFAFALLLMIVELLGCAGFLFWMGLSAAGTGFVVLALPTLHWPLQVICFALGSILCSILWWLHLRNAPTRTDNVYLNQRSQQYVGRIFTLDEAIVNGRGQIKVDDSQWRVEGDDLPAGTKVKVASVDGVVLKVEKFIE